MIFIGWMNARSDGCIFVLKYCKNIAKYV